MALPRGRGTPVPQGVEREAGTVLGAIGDANMQRRGTTLGTARDGEDAGHMDAVWAALELAGSETEIRVGHALGRVPSWVKLWECEDLNGSNGNAVVSSVKKPLWSASEVILRVHATGTYSGLRLLLLIG